MTGLFAPTTKTRPAVAGTPAVRPDAHPIAVWLLICCGMMFVMVMLGGITRLTQSGVSITEWRPVIGIVPPLSQPDWLAEFAKYKEIPQYRVLNQGMSLAGFKTIFWWEYAHRLWGRLIGVAYLLPFLYFLARGRIPRRLAGPLAGIFALGAAQGALGWYMVESGLTDRVEVSQYRLVGHLALALAIYALTLWVALGLFSFHPHPDPPPHAGEGVVGAATSNLPRLRGRVREAAIWRRAGEAIIALVALTICAGGFTAGLHAGLTYNTFPLMDGDFVPSGYAQLQPFARNWFENIAAVQFDHRLLAETTFIVVLMLWLIGWRRALPRPAHLALHALLGAAVMQFALGVATLLLVVPVPLAAAHQAGAVLLLTAAIALRHAVRRGEIGPRARRAPIIAAGEPTKQCAGGHDGKQEQARR